MQETHNQELAESQARRAVLVAHDSVPENAIWDMSGLGIAYRGKEHPIVSWFPLPPIYLGGCI